MTYRSCVLFLAKNFFYTSPMLVFWRFASSRTERTADDLRMGPILHFCFTLHPKRFSVFDVHFIQLQRHVEQIRYLILWNIGNFKSFSSLVMTSCNLVGAHRGFIGTYRLHFLPPSRQIPPKC